MIASLKHNGKMGAVMPHGVLFRGSEEGKFRQELIAKRNILEAVIGLPSGLFYGTGNPPPRGTAHYQHLSMKIMKNFIMSIKQSLLER